MSWRSEISLGAGAGVKNLWKYGSGDTCHFRQ